ncbi:MAG: hypothetical protein ACD_56C00121G0002 [uncultured bacterium]|nr:MAG: hypothetical protein ACD_56C00121G0002 [uncultured bacterium]
MQFILIGVVSFASAPKAKAFEYPLRSVINFSQEKISDFKEKKKQKDSAVPEIKEKDQAESSVKPQVEKPAKNENKKEKLSAPKVVDDPKEIERAVEFASQKTGVRKDFLMGMLVVESNLGRNPGSCTYDEVERGAQQSYENGNLSSTAWETFQDRREKVQHVAKDLGYDYKQLKVSCNPSGYAGTGGAMGIPQFMPDTWIAYKDEIGGIVGKRNPDPWNIKDGVVAMALLLADTPGVTEHNLFAERNAAKMYLSGTTSWRYDWYANQILYWAANYRQLLG